MKYIGIIYTIFFFITVCFAKEITVDPNGSVSTLTGALQLANTGDRIVVKKGIYREGEIVIDKSIEIVGEDFPVFDGEGKHQILTIRANNVTIRGLTIKDCGVSFIDDKAGIKIEEGNNCRIEGNKLIGNFFGIYLSKTRGTQVINNQIQSNAQSEAASGNGVHLWYCKDIVVEDNRIEGHRDGIYFEFVEDGVIRDNESTRNLRYGLHFMFSDRCEYRNNFIHNNGAGVAVMYTKNVIMDNNRFENNWGSASYGLLLKDITDSQITNNRFFRNSIGIYAENSSRIQVENNGFAENGWALKIMANCMDNVFIKNQFIGNSFDVATNSRNNFSRFEQNYWSSYKGYDLNRDGFGDVPFRPVRLFSLIVEQHPTALILLRSLFIDILDIAETIFPVLTPETLVDKKPLMRMP